MTHLCAFAGYISLRNIDAPKNSPDATLELDRAGGQRGF